MLERAFWLLIAVLWMLAECAGGQVGNVLPTEAAPFRGALASISGDWQLVFKTSGANRSLPATNLVSWGALPAMSSRTVALLADGGQLSCGLESADREKVQFDSPLFGRLNLPISSVAAIVTVAPSAFEPRDLLIRRVLGFEGKSDRLLLENGDELDGTIESIKGPTIEFKSDVGPAQIEVGKVLAIIFNPLLRSPAEEKGLQALVGFEDGSWFRARAIAWTPTDSDAAGMAQAQAAGGWTAQWNAADLAFLQPLGGRAEYLSDVEPRGYKHIPFLSLEWRYARDGSAHGGLLRWDDRVYPKGIGMHSAARLTFGLRPDHKRFEAEIALDAASGRSGSVTFRVYVDNKQQYASPIVRGGEPPIPISLDVSRGKLLSLIVDFAERGDELDHANWLNARLIK